VKIEIDFNISADDEGYKDQKAEHTFAVHRDLAQSLLAKSDSSDSTPSAGASHLQCYLMASTIARLEIAMQKFMQEFYGKADGHDKFIAILVRMGAKVEVREMDGL